MVQYVRIVILYVSTRHVSCRTSHVHTLFSLVFLVSPIPCELPGQLKKISTFCKNNSNRELIFECLFQKYVENVKQDASIGTNILRVSASDEDADNNGAIVYSLSAPYNSLDLDYFEIQPESGWIVLKKPLDVSSNKSSFMFKLCFYKQYLNRNNF